MFPLDQVPEMARGAGRDAADATRTAALATRKVFRLADGLSWRQGERTRTETDLRQWLGDRAQVGRNPPHGFPKSGRFG